MWLILRKITVTDAKNVYLLVRVDPIEDAQIHLRRVHAEAAEVKKNSVPFERARREKKSDAPISV